MLRSLKDLERYVVNGTDGDIGKVADFVFCDDHWVIRHLVVETGSLFDGEQVLVSPVSFREVDWNARSFHVDLSKRQVRERPKVETHAPISPQRAGGAAGTVKASGHSHLRSVNEVRGYQIQGSDGVIGHVKDFIIQDDTWRVRYLVVDTSKWWFGRSVLVSPDWARTVSWADRKVYLDLCKEQIKDSPLWSVEAAIERNYEKRLYDHYQRSRYWEEANPSSPTSLESSSRLG